MEINRINSKFMGLESLSDGNNKENTVDSFSSILNSKYK